MIAAQLHAAADGPRDHATARSNNTARGPRLSVRDARLAQRLAMSSTNGNKGEPGQTDRRAVLEVRLPVSFKQLAPQLGVSVAQLIVDLAFKLNVHVPSINMDLPAHFVVALAELHNLRVKFLPADDGVGS